MASAAVVVPCHNEAARLQPDRFVDALDEQPGLELILVDSGSLDDTVAVLERVARARPHRATLIQLAENRGKSGAVRHGMLVALESTADYIGYWDADLATPLESIPEFIALAESSGATVVIGDRSSARRDWRRALISRLFAWLARRRLTRRVTDTQCGAKLFRNDDSTRALFAEPFVSPLAFDVEILARMGSGGRLEELPLPYWRDIHGSSITMAKGLRAFRDLWRIPQQSK